MVNSQLRRVDFLKETVKNPRSSATRATTAQLEQSRVTLKNGQVNVGIKVHSQQSSFLTAKWVDGPTPLKDTTVLVSPLMWNY
jgi:hypothetical protein